MVRTFAPERMEHRLGRVRAAGQCQQANASRAPLKTLARGCPIAS